jgi:hypothetical protein
MKPKTYNLLEQCVQNGATRGYQRSFKHIDNPSEESICDNIVDAIMLELSEWFDFEAVEE